MDSDNAQARPGGGNAPACRWRTLAADDAHAAAAHDGGFDGRSTGSRSPRVSGRPPAMPVRPSEDDTPLPGCQCGRAGPHWPSPACPRCSTGGPPRRGPSAADRATRFAPSELGEPASPWSLEENRLPADKAGKSVLSSSRLGRALSSHRPCRDYYVCLYPGCRSTMRLKRRADLERHMKSQHEAARHQRWCEYPDCKRSKDGGGKPFSTVRADHYTEHLRNVHHENIPKKYSKRARPA